MGLRTAAFPGVRPVEDGDTKSLTTLMSRWQRQLFAGVLVLAALLRLARLDHQGFGNLYYAAAIQSMMRSWHNLLFVAFDPAGFLAVDKPPLGLWLQVASVKIFGWSGESLFLPQAIAGVLSVGVLFFVVRRTFGFYAALIAALVLALTPVNVAADRNNTMDSLLVLVLVCATWTLGSAVRSGRLRPLLWTALLIGVGFNIKMAQVFLPLPAFFLWYFLGAPLPRPQRVRYLMVAAAVIMLVSLPWVLLVDLTPAAQRPFVTSSSNSEIDLILGHNGATRLMANPFHDPIPQTAYVTDEIGLAGPLRLWQHQLGGQVSWLIPLALIGLLAAWWPVQPPAKLTAQRLELLMWAVWLAAGMLLFSFGHKFHRYYLEMLSPAVAALVGAGVVALWLRYQSKAAHRWLLPFALLVTAASQVAIVASAAQWRDQIAPVLIVASLLASLVLLALQRRTGIAAYAAGALGLLALMIGPAVWSLTTQFASQPSQPYAGPELFDEPDSHTLPRFPQLIAYLQGHQDSARFLVATIRASTAAPLMLESGDAVMTLGGYSGGDEIMTPEQLAAHVAANDVRFILLPTHVTQQEALATWVGDHCVAVATDALLSTAAMPDDAFTPALGGAQTLFDCGAPAAARTDHP